MGPVSGPPASLQVRRLPMSRLWELLEEQLAHGAALLPVTGNSMWPLLAGGRDMVRLVRPDRPVGRGDVILYRRAGGQYVLHRVIRCGKDSFICCGDNQWERETVPGGSVIAVVTAFCRKGRWHETRGPGVWRLYAWLWSGTFPARRPLLRLVHLLRRLRGMRSL